MVTLGVDYSWTVPSAATIKAAGYKFAMRYLSADRTKNLSAPEAKALLGAGLGIGLVWELHANRAAEGRTAGVADARAAETQATTLGYPATAVIFYAVDFDANPAQVSAYFVGVRSAARRPVGVYGSARVVEAVHAAGVPYVWQACAWSGGRVSTVAHLYQRLRPTVPHPIGGTDENVLIEPFPMWTAAHTLPAKTKPAKAPPVKFVPPVIVPPKEAPDMVIIKTKDKPDCYVMNGFSRRHIVPEELADYKRILHQPAVEVVAQSTMDALTVVGA